MMKMVFLQTGCRGKDIVIAQKSIAEQDYIEFAVGTVAVDESNSK